MSSFMVYLVLTVVPGIRELVLFIFFGVLIVGVIYAFMGNEKLGEHRRIYYKRSKRWIVASFIVFSVYVLLPARDELVACVIIPKVLNSEVVIELPADLTEVYDLGMQKLIQELAPQGL